MKDVTHKVTVYAIFSFLISFHLSQPPSKPSSANWPYWFLTALSHRLTGFIKARSMDMPSYYLNLEKHSYILSVSVPFTSHTHVTYMTHRVTPALISPSMSFCRWCFTASWPACTRRRASRPILQSSLLWTCSRALISWPSCWKWTEATVASTTCGTSEYPLLSYVSVSARPPALWLVF